MIDRILVPLDGSRVAEQILPHLRRLLYRRDAEVILVRAVVPPPIEDGVAMTDTLEAAARAYLAPMQDHLQEQGVRVRFVVRVGSAVGVILDVAEEVKATMMAMATHGETGLRRLLSGSVAESVLKKSPVPVLVVRPFWSYELLPTRTDREDLRPLRNFLLPLDGNDDKSVLIPPLVELARLFEARVVLLHVLEPANRDRGPLQDGRKDQEAHLMEYARTFQEQGVPTLSLVGRGDAVQEILATARAHEIDLIAMTSHGSSGFFGALSSSVTEKVLHDSTCPMLVVRSEAAVEAGGERRPMSGATRKERS